MYISKRCRPFILICGMFLAVACNKEKLTKATQEGANTFSCKVNGSPYIAQIQGVSLSGADPIVVHNFRNGGFSISTIDKRTGETFATSVSLYLPYLQNTGTYALSVLPGSGVYEHNYSPGPSYRTDASHTGTVKITRCDEANGIYSGTFSFTAIDNRTGKVVKVTDGRFDVRVR